MSISQTQFNLFFYLVVFLHNECNQFNLVKYEKGEQHTGLNSDLSHSELDNRVIK